MIRFEITTSTGSKALAQRFPKLQRQHLPARRPARDQASPGVSDQQPRAAPRDRVLTGPPSGSHARSSLRTAESSPCTPTSPHAVLARGRKSGARGRRETETSSPGGAGSGDGTRIFPRSPPLGPGRSHGAGGGAGRPSGRPPSPCAPGDPGLVSAGPGPRAWCLTVPGGCLQHPAAMSLLLSAGSQGPRESAGGTPLGRRSPGGSRACGGGARGPARAVRHPREPPAAPAPSRSARALPPPEEGAESQRHQHD